MAQFDICRMKAGGSLVVWLQHDLFSDQKTTIVAPLLRIADQVKPAGKTNPTLKLNGEIYIIAMQGMAAVQVSELSEPVWRVAGLREQIAAAVDLLFFGI
jgi:toxin CcdB